MAKSSVVAAVALALLAAAALLMGEPAQAAIDCSKARGQLAPCGPYLTGSAGSPSDACCKGVQFIKDNTDTKADRQDTCRCLKDTATAMTNLNDGAAQQLPAKCKVAISVPISRTVDCNNIE